MVVFNNALDLKDQRHSLDLDAAPLVAVIKPVWLFRSLSWINDMTTSQIRLVQATFAQVQPIAGQAAALFYARLFEIAPEVRPLFRGDLREQGRKLMGMIAYAVAGLDRLDMLVGAVRDMGRRHAAYGVKDSHYDIVASALLWTLEKGLGEAFTAEVKEAWVTAYSILAATMKDGAAKTQAATA